MYRKNSNCPHNIVQKLLEANCKKFEMVVPAFLFHSAETSSKSNSSIFLASESFLISLLHMQQLLLLNCNCSPNCYLNQESYYQKSYSFREKHSSQGDQRCYCIRTTVRCQDAVGHQMWQRLSQLLVHSRVLILCGCYKQLGCASVLIASSGGREETIQKYTASPQATTLGDPTDYQGGNASILICK